MHTEHNSQFYFLQLHINIIPLRTDLYMSYIYQKFETEIKI
jgi:hypothetical protein